MAPIPGSMQSQSRFGFDQNTGALIYGWDHCQQSITIIVTTALNSRFMRLTFGSRIPDILDRPGNLTIIMQWYVAIATAISAWEPGYRLRTINLAKAGPDGQFSFVLDGIFYPRGHLGDYSISESKQATVVFFTAVGS